MMRTNELRGIIASRGYSQRKCARLIGMSDATFYAKMKNNSFSLTEASKLIELLDIQDIAYIFFGKEVTCEDTGLKKV